MCDWFACHLANFKSLAAAGTRKGTRHDQAKLSLIRNHHQLATSVFDRSLLLPTGPESEGGRAIVGRWPRPLINEVDILAGSMNPCRSCGALRPSWRLIHLVV